MTKINFDKGLTRLGYVALGLAWVYMVVNIGFDKDNWAGVGEYSVYFIVFGGLCSVVYRLIKWAIRGFFQDN